MNKKPVIKCIFLGNSNVGKTSVIWKLIREQFGHVDTTIALQFFAVKKEKFHFHMWDTAGQEKFRSLLPSYIRNTHVIFFVCDITDTESIESIKDVWLKTVLKTSENIDFNIVQPVLIYNKCDKLSQKEIEKFKKYEKLSKEILQVFLRMKRIKYCELNSTHFQRVMFDDDGCEDGILPVFYTSAKDGSGIDDIFETVEDILIKKDVKGVTPKKETITLQNTSFFNNDTFSNGRCNC